MPDIQAQTPDGVVHSFPDGTAPDVITGAIKKYLGAGAAPRPSETELVANRPNKTAPMPDPGERADSAFGKVAQGQEAETLGNADVAREWWKRGPAELGSGVKGFTSHGSDAEGPHPYARSFNRMVSGAGVTALPAIANLLPMAAAEAPAATALSLGTGAAAQTGVEKGGELLGADPEVAKAAGNVAGIVGASLGPRLPDVPGAVQIAKEGIGRAARVAPTVDTVSERGTLDLPKKVSTLKPGVKAVASLGKLVGGPEVTNAVIPGHPDQIGPFSRIPDRIPKPKTVDPAAETNAAYEQKAQDLMNRQKEQDAIDRKATVEKERLEKEAQKAADDAEAARNQHGQDLMNRQSQQDKLDADAARADNAAARQRRDALKARDKTGQDLMDRQAQQDKLDREAARTRKKAEDARNQLAQDRVDRQAQQDALDAKHAKALKDLEDARQKELSDRGRLNEQDAAARNRRGETKEEPGAAQTAATLGPNGNVPPAPAPPAQPVTLGSNGSNGQDLITRTRKVIIPGDEPNSEDLKRAGDFTQAPLERLKTLAKFGDKLAQNELNRRLKN